MLQTQSPLQAELPQVKKAHADLKHANAKLDHQRRRRKEAEAEAAAAHKQAGALAADLAMQQREAEQAVHQQRAVMEAQDRAFRCRHHTVCELVAMLHMLVCTLFMLQGCACLQKSR